MEELNDFEEWCISEQGVWGIPIPYFVRKDTGEPVISAEIARHVAEVFKIKGGADAWFRLPIRELLPPRLLDQADNLIRGDQLFDIWFESAFSWDYALCLDAHSKNDMTKRMSESLSELPSSEQISANKRGGRSI